MSSFPLVTKQEAQAVANAVASRVGLEVVDRHGKAYWVTDVVGERLRVTDELGASFWFDEPRAHAEPIRELKKAWRDLGEQVTKRKTRRA